MQDDILHRTGEKFMPCFDNVLTELYGPTERIATSS